MFASARSVRPTQFRPSAVLPAGLSAPAPAFAP